MRMNQILGSIIRGADLSGAILTDSDLSGADFSTAILRNVDFSEAILKQTNLSRANLAYAIFNGAILNGAILNGADLRRSDLRWADLWSAKLIGANLSSADLSGSDFSGTDLSGADLSKTNLVETILRDAVLTDCLIYGIAAWNVRLEGATQNSLIITPENEPHITVDNLKIAQFIYLLLNNQEIRDVIDTIGQKGVLILGRFSEERKLVLDALREKLRTLNFLPIVFDFERSAERDFTETIMILAGLSCFIIADITNPKSTPLELQATVPNYMIPFVPIIQEGEQPFSMFQDLEGKYDWVLDILVYDTPSNLIKGLERAVVKPALEMRDELLSKKVEQLRTRHIEDYL